MMRSELGESYNQYSLLYQLRPDRLMKTELIAIPNMKVYYGATTDCCVLGRIGGGLRRMYNKLYLMRNSQLSIAII